MTQAGRARDPAVRRGAPQRRRRACVSPPDPGHGSTEHRSGCKTPAIRAPPSYRIDWHTLCVRCLTSAALEGFQPPRFLWIGSTALGFL